MPGVVFVLILMAAVVALALALANHRTTVAQWTQAADRLGLDLQTGSMFSYPRMDGLVSGYEVSVRTITKGSGDNQRRYTRFQVQYPPLDLGLELARQTKVGGFFRRMVGMQDIETGDPAFDEEFVVKAEDPDRLAAWLTGQRRSTLSRLLATYPTLRVTDTSVLVEVRKVVRDPDVITSTVRRLVGVGQSLGGQSAEVDEAVAARAAGDLAEALHRMREAVEARPDDVERRLQEIDTLAAAGRSDDLDARMTELERLAPADPEVRGWKQSGTASAAPPADLEGVRTIDADAATQDLFGGRQLSFAVRDKFAANYAGGRVHWTGKVKSARSYESDADFGRGPGVKVVATVAGLEHDLFGTTEVDAIVEFPGSGTVPERGTVITFDGTLTAVDPLMRNFTVRGATLP